MFILKVACNSLPLFEFLKRNIQCTQKPLKIHPENQTSPNSAFADFNRSCSSVFDESTVLSSTHIFFRNIFFQSRFLINCSPDHKCENTWTKQQQQKNPNNKAKHKNSNRYFKEHRTEEGQCARKQQGKRDSPLRTVHQSLQQCRSSCPSTTAQTSQFQSPLASAYIFFATSSSQLLHGCAALPVTQRKGEESAKMPVARPPCLVVPGSPQSKSCQLGNVFLMLHDMLINSHQGEEGFLSPHVWEVTLALSSSLLKLPSWDWGFKERWGKAMVEIPSLPSLLGLSHTASLFSRNSALKNSQVPHCHLPQVANGLKTTFHKFCKTLKQLFPLSSRLSCLDTEQRPGKATHKHQPQGMGETNHPETKFNLRPNLRHVSHWLTVKPKESLVCKMQTSACKRTCSASFQNILLRRNILTEYFKAD